MKYLPIILHFFYIVFTLAFSFWGPRVYFDYNREIVLGFIAIYLIFICLGFYLGVHKKTELIKSKSISEHSLIKILKISLKLSIILLISNVIYLYFSGSINFNSVGSNYRDYYSNYREKTAVQTFTFELLLLILIAVPKFYSLVFGFFYFDKLGIFYKRLFVLLLALIVFTQTYAIGNQKSLGDIIIYSVIFLGLKAYYLSPKYRRKLFLRASIILVLLFGFLSYSQFTRMETVGVSADEINEVIGDTFYYDTDHLIFHLFGPKLGLGMSVFISGYLSGGYYGLSLCLQLPFEWTYGIGNSVGLTTIVDKVFETDIYSKTYLGRMEETYGIPGKRQWHTVFPWLASDFSFYLLPIVLFIVAYLYGYCWREVLLFTNPISYLMFSLLTIFFVFVPANNQIFHGYDYIQITIFSAIYWLILHKRFNFKASDNSND